MSASDMLSSGSVYAVPSQLVFKRWAAADSDPKDKTNKQSANFTRTLLITHASDEVQVFVLAPPSTSRFELSVASSTTSAAPTNNNKHPNSSSYLIPHLSKPKASFYALPPQATLTCTIAFQAPQDVATNYQDAVFIYTPHCVATPFLTVPLLAIAKGDTAPTSTFVPTSLAAPPNPSPQLFNDYLSHRQQEEDEQRQQKALQQQFKSNSRKATHAPDVFVVNDEEDDTNDPNDEEMQSASDDGEDISASESRSSNPPDSHRPASRSASSSKSNNNQDFNLSALGQRIAAEAARAEAEDDMQDIAPSSSSSSSSRSSLTTAGVLRTGLSARLHSSAGGRSGGANPSSSRGRPPEIGQQQVYQPFQRPTTAEQRHLTEALDSGFIISTESAIDALVEEDMEAEEEEEERKLLQSSQGRPSTAARYNATQVPTLNITPAILAEENGTGKSAEEDEADFYKQILLTARSSTTTTAATTTPTPSSNSRPPRPSSVRRTTSGSSRSDGGSGASASPPIDYEVLASSGLSRKLSSDAYQDQAASTTNAPYRPRSSSSSNSSSRPVSRSSPPASAAPLSAMMRSMQLGGPAAAGEDWQERLAREQEIERRRHQNAASIPSMRMQPDEQPSRPTVTRFPSLKK